MRLSFLQRYLLHHVCLISVLFVIYGFIQLTNEDTELGSVCFAWGLILKKKKPDFLLPSPLVWVLVLVREVMYLPAQLLHAETLRFRGYLWEAPGALLLSVVNCVSESLVSDSAPVCCCKRMCSEQMNLRSLPFRRVQRTNLFSLRVCPCFAFLGWPSKVSILLQLCCFWNIETVPFSCVLFDRHFSLPFFLIDLTAVEAPFDFAGNKFLCFEGSLFQL